MNDTQDAMREMGELLDPVQEQLRRMLHEFGDEHYHTCPADNDSGPCDCFSCGGSFSSKRIIINGQTYHERCSYMSYPPHTHEDCARLNDKLSEAVEIIEALLGIELGSGEKAMAFLASVSSPPGSGK